MLPLDEMTRGSIKQLVASWNGKGLKKRTKLNILALLRGLYDHAIDDGVVSANPVAKVCMIVKGCQVTSKHIDPFTADEIRSLLSSARTRYAFLYPLFLCAVRTDMREGELIGLSWEDIDFHGGFIEVRHNVVRREETDTKMHKIRRVDVSPQFLTSDN